jgi:hypothetical protein
VNTMICLVHGLQSVNVGAAGGKIGAQTSNIKYFLNHVHLGLGY